MLIKKITGNKYFWITILILWFILSIIASIIPSNSMLNDELLGYDKLLHAIKFASYSMIIFILYQLFWKNKEEKIVFSIFFLLYPIVDESFQIFVPSRDFSIYDVIANYIGFSCGLLIMLTMKKYIYTKRKK